MHLETERLLMPPLSGQHTGALAEVYADPDVARYIGGAPLDAEGAAVQVARCEAVCARTAWARARSSTAGRGLPRPGRAAPLANWDEVELGFVLARHAQGRGLATEAARAWLDVAFGEQPAQRCCGERVTVGSAQPVVEPGAVEVPRPTSRPRWRVRAVHPGRPARSCP